MALEPRRASDGIRNVAYARADGSIRTMHVTDDGLFKPQDAEDEAALTTFGLAVVTSEPKPKAARKPRKRKAKVSAQGTVSKAPAPEAAADVPETKGTD